MVKIRNAVASYAIMFTLIVLIVTAFNGIRVGYDLDEENLQDDKNVFEKLQELNLIAGINDLTIGIQSLGKLSNPADLIGALAIAGSGTLQVIGGIVTFPVELFAIVFGFYDNVIPPVVAQLIGILSVISVGFILLSAKLGFEL
jgi:hypothetical protein